MTAVSSDATSAGIIIALITLIGKIWYDSSNQSKNVIDVVRKNAIAMTKLEQSIKANTRVTEKSADVSSNLSKRIENVLTDRTHPKR